jgi:CSLREA domain-containing protein
MVAALTAALLFQAEPSYAAAITVNTTTDELNSDGDCSLREAITAANANTATDACAAGSGTDTITLPAGTYTLSVAGIGEDANATGDLDLTSNITINGAGATTTVIDANDIDRVMHIVTGTVDISGVTIRNGNMVSATDNGGGIRNTGTVTLTESIVSDNTSLETGGITIYPGGTMTVIDSTIRDNTSSDNSGGIYNNGTLTIDGSTISGNSATAGTRRGGGLYSDGPLTITNSTISGNTALQGGGIYAPFFASILVNTTITDNTATSGAGIERGAGNFSAKSTIVANNTGPECNAGLVSNGNNLDSDDSCFNSGGTDQVNTNPLLGALSFNGGPTKTHGLGAGSPAIDTGANTGAPAIDQRGVARPFDGDGAGGASVDIGAYEVAPTTFTPTRSDDPAPDGCAPEDCSLREAIIAANQDSASDTIDLGSNYQLSIAGAAEDAAATGDLDITQSVTITGDGAGATSIDTNDLDRVFHIVSGTVELSDVTVQDGRAQFGAGIYNQGTLTLENATVTNNDADTGGFPRQGAGIYNANSLTLTNSTVSDNTTGDDWGPVENEGGGIFSGSGTTLALSDSMITGNSTINNGGGIWTNGTLTLNNSTVSENSAGIFGGGIYNSTSGTATLTEATVSDNEEPGALDSGNQMNAGGGAGLLNGGTMTVTDSGVIGNTAAGNSAGISNVLGGTLTVTRSTVSGNSVPSSAGGGIGNAQGTVTLANSTVSGNSASSGGGISNNSTFSASFSTIANNSAGAFQGGGGIRNSGGTVELNSTIVANSTSGGDCNGTLTSTGYNLIEDTTACTITGDTTGNMTGSDPALGALADNGGPTKTHKLLANSPAAEAADPDCPPPTTDQRGVVRAQGADCDIGAYEDRPPTAVDDPNYSTDEDTQLQQNGVLDNDTDPDGDTLTAVLVSGPTHDSSFTLNSDGTFDYTPEANFNGTDSFTYKANDGNLESGVATATITVDAINDAPTAVNDPDYSTDEDTPLSQNGVLDNDTDPEDDGLTAVLVSGPDHEASFTLNSDGTFDYTPEADFNGSDTFTYKANDGDLDSEVATATITVDPVNDPPTGVVTPKRCLGGPDTAARLRIAVGDIDDAPGSLLVDATSSKPSLIPDGNLIVTGTGANRTLELTALGGQSGKATITITVNDGDDQIAKTIKVKVGTGSDNTLQLTGPGVLFGRAGNDLLDGSTGADLLCGGKGADRLRALSSDDVLMGAGGPDRLLGGAADDLLFGQSGDDRLTGGIGSDFFSGGPGSDTNTDFNAGEGDTSG